MDTLTGDLYESKQAGLDAGVPAENLVELISPQEEINKISRLVKAQLYKEKLERTQKAKRTQFRAGAKNRLSTRAARSKMQKASRRGNR